MRIREVRAGGWCRASFSILRDLGRSRAPVADRGVDRRAAFSTSCASTESSGGGWPRCGPSRVVRLYTGPESKAALPRPLDQAAPVVYSYWTVRASQDPRLAVGLIGLGNMGTAFAERLLDAGYPLVVSNRTPEKAQALAARGAAARRLARRTRRAGRRDPHVARRRRCVRRGGDGSHRGGAAGLRPRRPEHGLTGCVGAGRRACRGGVRRIRACAREREPDCRSRREPELHRLGRRPPTSIASSRSSGRSARPCTASVTESRLGSSSSRSI